MRRPAALATLAIAGLVLGVCPALCQKKAPPPKRPSPDGWVDLPRERSKIDDTEIIAIRLRGQNVIQGWLARARPELYIRWKEGEFEAYIWEGMPAEPELGVETFTVRVRFDSQPATVQQWEESNDHESLFSPAAIDFINKLASAKKLTFEFTPFQAPPQVIDFDVRGLSRHMDDNFDDWRDKP